MTSDVITITRTGDRLQAAGPVDEWGTERLRDALAELDADAQVELDLTDVDYLNSVGITVLAQALQRFDGAEGELVLVAGSDSVAARVLTAVGVPFATSPQG